MPEDSCRFQTVVHVIFIQHTRHYTCVQFPQYSMCCTIGLQLAICLLVKSDAEFMFILQSIYFLLYLRYCSKKLQELNTVYSIGQNIRNRPDTQPLPELTNMLQCFRNLKLKLHSEEFVYVLFLYAESMDKSKHSSVYSKGKYSYQVRN